ncbi:MAG: hypothetical protein II755_13725, partial [Prevotella sp.]|nr:hypothetical protein [Prevotella sp.]
MVASWDTASKITKEDFKVHGAIYSYMRDGNDNALKNDAAGNEAMMNTLRYWNASYQQFNAEDLIEPEGLVNIWYAQVVGADDSYLADEDHNGVMRIYNDPGSQYHSQRQLGLLRALCLHHEPCGQLSHAHTKSRPDIEQVHH